MTPDLDAAVQAGLAARERLRTRPRSAIAAALAAAAAGWQRDEPLIAALPAAARLSPAMIASGLPIVASAIDLESMIALVEGELGAGAAALGAPAGPAVVVQLLASNVPALAVPAIALGCLAGVVTICKSGRDDRLSGPAFHRALAAVDPELAATVVPAYWERDAEMLDRADLVIATGSDETLAALHPRLGARLVGFGTRTSVAVVGERVTPETVEALARDVVRWDQRGCLSPHTVYADGDLADLGHRLAAALATLAVDLRPGPSTVEERAAVRARRDAGEWSGAERLGGPDGTVIVGGAPFDPCGGRTVQLLPRAAFDQLPPGRIECVGVAAVDLSPAALRDLGVARRCRVGDMQRPPLSWPRGQRPALGTLLGRSGPPQIEVTP